MNKQDWFLNIKETAASSCKMKGALRIAKVAPKSPAAELGLVSGDIFLSVNGRPALTTSIVDVLLKGKKVTYEFFQPKAQKHLKVKTAALPLGLKTEATSDAIVARFKATKNLRDFDGIMTLWERGHYDHLRNVSKNAKTKGLMGKLLPGGHKLPIASLIDAVCDIEVGDKTAGYAALDVFEDQHMANYTSDIGALTRFYQAMKIEGTSGPDFTNRLWDVMDSHQNSDRMVAAADKYEVDYDRKGQRQGTKFAYGETLRCLEGAAGKVDVAAMAKSLKTNELLPICLMYSYRGNGPYDDAMKIYHSIYPHIKSSIAPMLVLTSSDQKRPDRPHWFESEEALIKKGVPITVAHDPDGGFVDRLLTGAPEFIAIDRDMNIVWDFPLASDYEYWAMLGGAKRP